MKVIPIECKFGSTSAYAYYIDAPEPALVDTGVVASVKGEITAVLQQNGRRIEDIKWILLTHGHVDHLGGAYEVWEATGRMAKVVIPQTEAYLLRDKESHLRDYEQLQGDFIDEETQKVHKSILMNDIGQGFEPSIEAVDGDILSLGGDITLSVVETPGHSAGLITYVINQNQAAFASDAVQMYGGAKSRIPTIQYPNLYRKSLKRLKEMKLKRMYLGHHFLNSYGQEVSEQLEGETAVQEVLNDSLQMDARLQALVQEYKKNTFNKVVDDEVYGTYKPIADALRYSDDPRRLPCAFFVTINSYVKEMNQ
ncbi:MBL fold metallo-hydrolase [Cytobacillus kochii]|uniref:MBL fold metallo-hydrolase n=1 Tax=Cytobacillus kochii TaxID=859143 RepID=UPI002E1D3CCC|nr:MBL fold metallo-hydrolase [Cytobacillus kochii]